MNWKLLVIWCCVPALAAPEPPQMLDNLGFEEGGEAAAWWAIHPKDDPTNRVVRDTSVAHTGVASGLVDSTGPVPPGKAGPQFMRYQIPARGGATLLLSFWTRSDSGAGGHAGIHSYAADGSHLDFTATTNPPDGSTWQPVRQLITLPPGTVKIGVALYGRIRAKVWFDDVSLLETPTATATRATPTIDGRLDEACWQPDHALSPFTLNPAGGTPTAPGAAWLAYDDETLYAAWHCPVPAGATLKLDATARDGDTWLDDSVELFCAPTEGSLDYVQICVNANGILRDSLGRDASYDTGARAAISRAADGFNVELAVPLKDLPVSLATGSVWGLNLVRNDRVRGEVSTWSADGFHRPARFGRVTLTPDLSARYAAALAAELPRFDAALAQVAALADVAALRETPTAAAQEALAAARELRATLAGPVTDWSLAREQAVAMPAQIDAARQALIGASFDSRDDRGGFRLALADSTTKVPRDQPVPAEAILSTVELLAARDETESFQVVVVANRDPLPNVTVEAPPLRGPGGELPIAWRRVDYVYTEAPKYPVAYSGWWPDPLLPAGPFAVDAGLRQPLWCSVSVPPDAAPGRYTGEVAVTCAGQTERVTVALEVLAVRLPRPGTLTTPFGLYAQPLAEWYHGKKPFRETMTVAEYRRWIDLMADYRLTPKNVAREYIATKDAEGRPAANLDALLETVKPYQETAFTPFGWCLHRLPSSASVLRGAEPKVYPEAWAQTTSAIAAEWRRLGLSDKVFLYGMDEPQRDDYPILQEVYRKVREAVPGLPLMQTIGDPNPTELVGLVDIWCPLTSQVSQPFYAARHAAGEQLWTYVCVSPPPPYANFFVDLSATTHRVLFWQAWQQGCTGLLYWDVTWWGGIPGPTSGQPCFPEVPIKFTDLPQTYQQWKVNGDGILLYPGPDMTPYPSVRLECIRDGIEDYETLGVLQRLVTRAEAAASRVAPDQLAAARALLEVPPEVSASMTDYTTTGGPLLARREAVLRAADALARALPEA